MLVIAANNVDSHEKLTESVIVVGPVGPLVFFVVEPAIAGWGVRVARAVVVAETVVVACGMREVGVKLTPPAEHVGKPTMLTNERSASKAKDA